MRIIFLNTWFDSNLFERVKKFVLEESVKTDIFVFTEFTEERLKDLGETLPMFGSYVAYNKELVNSLCFQAAFVKNSVQVDDYSYRLINEKGEDTREVPGFVQRLDIDYYGKKITIGGLQGLAYPGNKLDNEMRIKQSENVLEFVKSPNPSIIGGDFNLLPETKSIKMFEDAGYRNLIKDFNIKSTRNSLTWEWLKDEPGFTKQYFADYCFVSKDVVVKNFEVPNLEISDHEPLILDFEI